MNNEIMPKTESDVKRMASIAMAVAVSAFTSVFAGYTVKDGYYVFDNAGLETCSEVLSGANGVMKLGAGTLVLEAENTFTGPLVISNGTIQVAQGKYLGTPSSVVIAPLGVLDVQETVNKYSVGGNDPIFPETTRMDVAGKIIRYGGFDRNYTFMNFHLSGDAELTANNKRSGVGGNVTGAGVYLQGHKLTIGGSTSGLQFGLGGVLDPDAGRESDGDFGSVEQTGGTVLIQSLTSIGGSSNNVWTLSGASTHYINFWDMRVPFPWTLNSTGSGGRLRAGIGRQNCWSGPVRVSDGAKLMVELYHETNAAKLEVSGPVSVEGSGTLDVNTTAIADSAVAFAGKVEGDAQSKVNVNTGADSLVAFSNDFILATGATFTKANPGTVEFAGPTNQFGASVDAVEGTVRFSGCDRVQFPVNLTSSTTKKANLEFADVGYVSLGRSLYVRGPGSDPSHLMMTNVTVGQVSSVSGVFLPDEKGLACYADICEGTLITNTFRVGGSVTNLTATPTKGALRQWGGVVVLRESKNTRVGENPGNYGYYSINGGETRQGGASGTFTVGNAGTAFCEMRGGEFNAYDVYVMEKRGYGQLRMTGGELNAHLVKLGNTSDAEASAEYVGQGVLSLSGSNTVLKLGDRINVAMKSPADFAIAVNDGARLESIRIGRQWDTTTGGHIHMSVDGGVLTHNGTAPGDWYNGAQFRPESFLVQDGGVVFEPKMTGNATNNFAVMSSDLAAPEGYVVTAIALPTAEGFSSEKYMGPAQIRIYGEGTDAVACVDYDDVLMIPTNITVVAKGTGYAASGTTAQMASADGKTWYDCEVTVAPVSATGRGLTKRGDQKLELTGVNTYRGDTCVEGGTLKLSGEYSLPVGSGLFVDSGATVDLGGVKRSVPTLGGAGTVVGSVDVSKGIAAVCAETPLSVTGTLTFGEGATFAVENPEALDPDSLEKYVLVTAGTISGPLPMLTGLEGRWRLSRSGNSLCVGIPRGTVIFVR